MTLLKLNPSGFAIVDDDSIECVNRFIWRINRGGYVFRRQENGRKIEYLHRRIMSSKKGIATDHRNGNKLDNQRSNLREASHAENMQNRGKCGPPKSSIFKGVRWNKEKRKWASAIYRHGKEMFLGYFQSEIDAARAYNNAAVEMFGEFSKLNPI